MPHYLREVLIALVCLGCVAVLAIWARRLCGSMRRWALALLTVAAVAMLSFAAVAPMRVSRRVPRPVLYVIKGGGIFVGGSLLYALAAAAAIRTAAPYLPSRRRAVQLLTGAAVATPAAVAGAAYILRNDLRINETEVRIKGLPADLNGLRLVQLSDIHLSPLVSEAFLSRAVDAANECRAHIALVTGDLITSGGDPLDACLRQLSRLRSDAGTYGCLGNHEVYADAEEYVTREGAKLGMQFLRRQSRSLRFGSAVLQLSGVDYQQRHEPYLTGAEKLIVPGDLNVLLSHNPDVIPKAAELGFDLTISGHTHGGQVTFEVLHPGLNPARMFTEYIYGLYHVGDKSGYVTRGVGTIGVPMRLCAAPEVALIRLCAT
jgi:predicted MPP superfamily phosphohydrolase